MRVDMILCNDNYTYVRHESILLWGIYKLMYVGLLVFSEHDNGMKI